MTCRGLLPRGSGEYIKGRLIAEAQECLSLYGIRKTTVDDLVKRANIAKGTFYLFFESKEMLFYEVLCAFHHQLEAELMEELESLSKDITAERLTELFFGLYKRLKAHSYIGSSPVASWSCSCANCLRR